MSPDVFDIEYSNLYDTLYGDKDYTGELELLENAFKRYSPEQKIEQILDLGCGTGNYAIPLAQRGYKISGVDISENMLIHAREKAKEFSVEPLFIHGDLKLFSANQTFDAAIMMFAVLGYQLENDEVFAALLNVQKHLRPGGLFVFDVWYGPAVLSIRPSDRVKIIPTKTGKVIRAASGSLDTYHHLSEVRYHLWEISNNKVDAETEERHLMRYFFPQELAFFTKQAGLELISLTAFPSLDKELSDETWNAIGVCRK
jgi:SAM-dependent methyltransferase